MQEVMGLITKMRKGIADPRKLDFFVRSRVNEMWLLLQRRRIAALLSYVITGLTSWSPYEWYLPWIARRRGSPRVVSAVRDFEMVLDLSDPGLSKELWLFGTREDKLATLFESIIADVCAETDQPIIIDAGANIGYYALIEAQVASEARIFAIEPVPANVDLLRENVNLNGFAEQISIHQCAVGATNGTGVIELHNRSNHHRLQNGQQHSNTSTGTMTVSVVSIDSFVTSQGISPGDVSVVRMDIEGFETEALRGMTEILAADGPTVLFIEVHNNLLSSEAVESVASVLDEHAFEIYAVESDTITWSPFDFSYNIHAFEELSEIDEAYGLIVRKNGSKEIPKPTIQAATSRPLTVSTT